MMALKKILCFLVIFVVVLSVLLIPCYASVENPLIDYPIGDFGMPFVVGLYVPSSVNSSSDDDKLFSIDNLTYGSVYYSNDVFKAQYGNISSVNSVYPSDYLQSVNIVDGISFVDNKYVMPSLNGTFSLTKSSISKTITNGLVNGQSVYDISDRLTNYGSLSYPLKDLAFVEYALISIDDYIPVNLVDDTSMMPNAIKLGIPVKTNVTSAQLDEVNIDIFVEFDAIVLEENGDLTASNHYADFKAYQSNQFNTVTFTQILGNIYDSVVTDVSANSGVLLRNANIDITNILTGIRSIAQGNGASYVNNIHIKISIDDESLSTMAFPSAFNTSAINEFYDNYGYVPIYNVGLLYNDIVVNSYDSMKLRVYNEMSHHITEIVNEQVFLRDFNVVNWLGDAVVNFFEQPIIGDVTIGNILYVVVGISLIIVFLKYFAGG